MPVNTLEQDRIASYESARQEALRRIRRDSRNRIAEMIGYVSTSGENLAATGDEEAMYVKVINASADPVKVELIGGSGPGSNVTVVNTTAAPVPVAGNVANAAVDSGNPIKIGGVAGAAAPAPAVDGSRVNASYDPNGRARALISSTGGDALTSNSSLQIGGNILDGGVDSGNPVKVGGVVSSYSQPLVTPGNRRSIRMTSDGRVQTTTLGQSQSSIGLTGNGTGFGGGSYGFLLWASITPLPGQAVDIYCHVAAGGILSAPTATLDVFFVGREGSTVVRDYSAFGGLPNLPSGGIPANGPFFFRFSTSPTAIVPPLAGAIGYYRVLIV